MNRNIKPVLLEIAAFTMSACLLMTGCSGGDWHMNTVNLEIHTDLQAAYLDEDDIDKSYNIFSYAKGVQEMSQPNPVELRFQAPTKDKSVTDYTVELSEYKSMKESKTYTTAEGALDIYNLELSRLYYYRVTANFSDGTNAVSPVKRFVTNDVAPRNLKVDGVSNVRDVGGWTTSDGGHVKQGMIYRGGEFNVAYSTTKAQNVTAEGKRVLLEELGIRSEIDLRLYNNSYHETANIKESPLGEDVNYYWCPVDSLTNPANLLTHNLEEVRHVFELLSDEENYPVYYHCRIGTDRTGMFAFMINGLCGVSYEDLCRDYLFSNFGYLDVNHNGTGARDLDRLLREGYIDTIRACEGDTLSEQIYNCLVGYGVQANWLDNIIAIMTEA